MKKLILQQFLLIVLIFATSAELWWLDFYDLTDNIYYIFLPIIGFLAIPGLMISTALYLLRIRSRIPIGRLNKFTRIWSYDMLALLCLSAIFDFWTDFSNYYDERNTLWWNIRYSILYNDLWQPVNIIPYIVLIALLYLIIRINKKMNTQVALIYANDSFISTLIISLLITLVAFFALIVYLNYPV